MGSADFSVGLHIGETVVDDTAVIYFAYGVMWDRGMRLDVLIRDPTASLHKSFTTISGTPTPKVTFTLQWLNSAHHPKPNKGTEHTLYVLKIGQTTTPEGLCIRIRCVDKAYLILRSETSAFHASNVKANQFIASYLDTLKLGATIPETGDRAGSHRTMHGQPLGYVRYELDRVLSTAGRPLSLQFDDRSGKEQLLAVEEIATTQPLTTLSDGNYVYGLGQPANGAKAGPGWGNSAYHYEMDQNFESVMWGHKVSVNHLTSGSEEVVGSMTSKLDTQLGVKSDLVGHAHRRLHMPRVTSDNPTRDDYYAQALMMVATWHAQVSATSGYILIDPDFTTFDDITMLNRKHVTVAITGGSNDTTGHALMPEEAVVMGYQHVINRVTSKTKLFLRRGTK